MQRNIGTCRLDFHIVIATTAAATACNGTDKNKQLATSRQSMEKKSRVSANSFLPSFPLF
jgi:hypothetical protein